ncbi:hypothetical protein B0H13DRAFT_2337635 [Mycena leptocephala]|nr:hypothetical protein B0H13DRAFT_2337635 [Mycena leptocephala]
MPKPVALKTRPQLMEALAKVRNSAILDTASARYYLEESQWITKGVPFSRAHLFEILSKISLLPQVSQKSMPETLRALAFMGEDLDGPHEQPGFAPLAASDSPESSDAYSHARSVGEPVSRASSEALGTFTCASCGEAVPLRSHRSLSLSQFDVDILKRPDLSANEENLLDRYKWLHPASTPAPMPFDELPFLARALPSAPTPRCLTVFA